MDTERRQKAPADFELVLGQGIHPFYLGMAPDQVMEAAVGWRIVSSEREFGSVRLEFEKDKKTIRVSILNTMHLYPGFHGDYQVYYISTYDARFSDGKRLSQMTQKNILLRFTGEHAVSPKDFLADNDDICSSSYENEEIDILFSEFLKPCISISRMPRLGWDEDD